MTTRAIHGLAPVKVHNIKVRPRTIERSSDHVAPHRVANRPRGDIGIRGPGLAYCLIQGSVATSFSHVQAVFAEIIDAQQGTGASFAVWHDGELVVDLWGGYADAGRTRSWQRDTLVMPYSVTKPFAALCVLTPVERGLVELDAPMQRYWPELRATASMRDMRSHCAGLIALEHDAPEEAFYDWNRMCSLLARQEPAWTPGTAQG